MAFFDENVRKAKEIGAEYERQNAALEEAFSALGKAYFSKHENDPEEGLGDYIASIAAAKKRTDIFRELSARARGVRVCKGCGAEIDATSAFCNVCGTKMGPAEPLTDGENVYCETCYRPMPIGQKFCSFCGAPLALADKDQPEAAAPAGDACANCGAPLAEGQKFCTVCGAKKEEAKPVPEAVAPVVNEAPAAPEGPAAEEPEVPEESAIEEAVGAVEEAVEETVEEAADAVEAAEETVEEAVETAEEKAEEAVESAEEKAEEAVETAEEAAKEPAKAEERICPTCGKPVREGMKFCTSCGTRMQDEPAPVERMCPACGKILAPNIKFCTGCGTKLG